MSTRTRIIIVHDGSARAGDGAVKWLLSYRKSRDITYPTNLKYAPKWRKCQYIFEQLVASVGSAHSQMLIQREGRANRKSRSKYITSLRRLGLEDPRRTRAAVQRAVLAARARADRAEVRPPRAAPPPRARQFWAQRQAELAGALVPPDMMPPPQEVR